MNWRSARLTQARQDAPTMQLQNAAAHQRMRGDGIRAIAAAIDQQGTHAFARNQHRSGSAGAARTDDQRVVGCVSEHVSLLRRHGTRCVQMGLDFHGQFVCVATHRTDEAGVAPTKKAKANDIQAG